MEASVAAKRGLEPLGIYRATAVAGCEPDEMGIGIGQVERLVQSLDQRVGLDRKADFGRSRLVEVAIDGFPLRSRGGS